MLFAITLTYSRPKIDVEAHLDTHRTWLVDEMKAGRILAAGPLGSGLGGFVLAFADSQSEIDAMVERDPFVRNDVVTFDIQPFQVALRSANFPPEWAEGAKPIG
jgi:uncharacterized protein YciI